jgi:hypothetical protein
MPVSKIDRLVFPMSDFAARKNFSVARNPPTLQVVDARRITPHRFAASSLLFSSNLPPALLQSLRNRIQAAASFPVKKNRSAPRLIL